MSAVALPSTRPQLPPMYPLAELAEFRRGLTYKKTDEVDRSDNVVLRANNIDLATGQMDLSDLRCIDPGISVPDNKRLVPESVLICTASGSKAHLGKAAYIDGSNDFAFGGFMGLLVPRGSITAKYLWYFTRSVMYFDFIGGLSDGANINNLNFRDLGQLQIPTPSLDEQKRIVAVLDQAFAALDRARAHTEANLADVEALFVRQREASLDGKEKAWKALTVEDVCERFEYGTSTKSLPEGHVPVLRMGNLQGGEVSWSDLKYTNDDGDIQKLMLHDGDVLFNRTNSAEHVGKTAIYRGTHPAIFAGYLIRLHVRKSVINPEYLNIFLNSNAAREYGRTVMGKSVNQANISASKLKAYPIEVPSLAEQKGIVENLHCIRKQIGTLVEAYEAKLTDLATLRQSLLQKAFAGELT